VLLERFYAFDFLTLFDKYPINTSLIICLLLAIGPFAQAQDVQPSAVEGVIDLRKLNQEELKSVALDGEWEFYWQQFVDPKSKENFELSTYAELPSSWNDIEIDGSPLGPDGYATYRLTILLDESVGLMALQMNVISTSYRLFINGDELLTVGIPATNKQETYPEYGPATVFFNPETVNEVIIQVANFDHRLGGVRDTVYLGDPYVLAKSKETALLTALFLGGCFFMMGLYHLVLYVINRDNAPLYFSLFCFILTIRVMVTGEIPITAFYSPDWYLLVKVEYLTFYLSGMAFLKFFSSMFQKFSIKFIENFCYLAVGTMSVLVVFTQPVFFTQLLVAMQVLIVLLMVYTFYILYKEYKNGNNEAVVFFLGYIFFMATIVNDILFVDEFIETGHLFFLGLFIFLGSQAALLSRRYSMAFTTNLSLLGQLNQANQGLETKVLQRTEVLNLQNETLEERNVKISSQNQELLKLNAELDRFVYSVSHDLKAPIASMLGLLHLSENEQDLDQLKQYMELMERSLKKQSAFISDILDYSKNARLELNTEPVDFKQLVQRVFEQHEFVDNWSSIEKKIIVNQEGDFISDVQRLAIVLNNLISNALKYSSIATDHPRVEVRIDANSEQADIYIIDNGSGIDLEHQDRVFEMFYRADDKMHGSGLGLYIVKETVDRLGGTIGLKSKKREGTTIKVTIPSIQVSTDN
jgi:signal transduction histidine kinase